MISALIFDMDGLMIDTERLYFETEREMVAEYGKTISEATWWKLMGRSPLEAVTILLDDLEIPVKPEDFLKERDKIMLKKMMNDLKPMAGLYEILENFNGRLKLAVATGAERPFLDLALDKLDIRKYFNILQTSDTIQNGKPHPEIYQTAVSKLALPASCCAILEDSSNGARAGKDAGCYAIAVPTEYTIRQDFSFVDFIAKNLIDANSHIESLLNGKGRK